MKNLTHRIALIIAIICVSSVSAFAQQVKGTVKDAAGSPIIGAAVVVDGTTVGTSTDSSGSFVIAAREGQTLVVSFIGYTTETISVGGGKNSL